MIELLVVIAILGFLATVGLVTLNSVRAAARDARRINDVQQIVKAAQVYTHLNNGTAPDTSMGYQGWCCLGFAAGQYCYGHIGGTPAFYTSYTGCPAVNTAFAPYLSTIPRDADQALPMTGYLYTSDAQSNYLNKGGVFFYLETEKAARSQSYCDSTYDSWDGGYLCFLDAQLR